MFAFQWRELSPPLSSAHRLLQCYHSQWEIGDAAIPGEFPPQPPATRAISQWASSLEWRHAVTLYVLVGKICISFFLFYCEGMLSLVVLLWLCGVATVLAHHFQTMVTPRPTLKEKMESFWPKKLSHCMVELKFDQGFRVIGEYLNQFDSQYRINLTQIFSNYSEYRVEI